MQRIRKSSALKLTSHGMESKLLRLASLQSQSVLLHLRTMLKGRFKMKRVTVYDEEGNAVNCWPDTAKKLIANGYSEEDRKGQKSEAQKSDEVATEVDEV